MGLTLWALVNAHISNCQQDKFASWNEARQSYRSIKEVTKLINNLYGRRVAVTLLAIVLYYAITFGKAQSWQRILYKVLVASFDVTILLVAADATYKVCQKLAWFTFPFISKCYPNISTCTFECHQNHVFCR